MWLNNKQEPEGGVVEHLYKSLAVQKTKRGKSIFVFWDKQCLNDGQNWQSGFIHGLQQSQVIILLLSNSVRLIPFYFFQYPNFGSKDNERHCHNSHKTSE
jgi:hypothetical protein